MTFDLLRQRFTREHIWVVEIIHNGNTWRFCENRAPLPLGLDAVPSLQSISISPTAVDLSGGLGVRASCSISIADHIDYATNKRFWPTWRASNPFYQGARLRVLSAYIDGSTYSEANAQPREYIIESWNYAGGKVGITAKDPLKLADNSRAQAPRATTVSLTAPVELADNSITVTSAAGWSVGDYLRIGEEVVEITSIASDVVGVARGQYNTVTETHRIDDAVQLCLYINDTLPNILYTLLVDYAGVDPAFIPLASWEDEASLWLPGLYETLITEPVGVQTLIKELTEQAPHFLFWDERSNLINLVALKQPPSGSTCLDDDSNLIADSVKVQDKNDLRISRVIVHFGQFNPTKRLDEFSNYRQTFVRVDTDSETNYGTPRIKTIYSRWINNNNKAAAIRLAARMGRTFHQSPRAVTFALDAKDGDIWTGTPCAIKTADIVDGSGNEYCMPVQVISAVEKEVYEYTALEHLYGPAVAEDADVDQPGKVVILSGEITNINLRTVYNGLFSGVESDDDVIFIFDSACTAGSTSTAASVVTGSWPELDTPPLIDVRGLLIGKGGNGADFGWPPQDGGTALLLQNDVRISNAGIIGGGGGGGAYDFSTEEGGSAASGGGGAGWLSGNSGGGDFNASAAPVFVPSTAGTKTTGGARGQVGFAFSGAGGDLGRPGGSAGPRAGGAAGAAINQNGYTITYVNAGAGDIRGAIL